MSFATVVPYAFIVDGPRAFRWWGGAGGGVGVGGAGAFAAAATAPGGDDDVASPGLASLALYLSVSGVLLFLHSAVRLPYCCLVLCGGVAPFCSVGLVDCFALLCFALLCFALLCFALLCFA